MQIQCSRCAQSLALDDAEIAGLRADAEIACPGCGLSIVLHPETGGPPPIAKPRAPRRGVAAPRVMHPVGAGARTPSIVKTRRLPNRNLLILGSAALLVLGGIGVFLANRQKRDIYLTQRSISNEIVHNKFFTDLVVSGAATEKDLQACSAIRSHGEGFIGMSKNKLTLAEAEELALNTGAEILRVNEGDITLMSELGRMLGGALGETLWVFDEGGAKMMDHPDLLPVSTLQRPRRTLLHWLPNNPYVKNKNWVRMTGLPAKMPNPFKADLRHSLAIPIRYNYVGQGPFDLTVTPYGKGAREPSDFTFRPEPVSGNHGQAKRMFGFSRAVEIDEVEIVMTSDQGKTRITSGRFPLKAAWTSSKSVELVSVKPPAALSPSKDIIIPANAGKRFTVSFTALYNTPRPTKLASNLLMEKAGILPPDVLAELKANHEATWHFDTESRSGYQSANGRGILTYELTGYAPMGAGTYNFDFNLGLFDEDTWATEVLKVHKVILNVSNP